LGTLLIVRDCRRWPRNSTIDCRMRITCYRYAL